MRDAVWRPSAIKRDTPGGLGVLPSAPRHDVWTAGRRVWPQGALHSPAGDIAPTGRAVAVDYIHVLRFRDGKHISFNLMFDRLLMLEQLGLIPAPAPTG